MPEILTESFCERCGTRYTFESIAPRKTRRLGQFKTLSKGLKNYVLSDDTSMDEAMAAARSDEEREATAQQLDAFHSTFNFCMNCRQYTCGNCWNQAEGRCLTCSPNLGQDILEAPFPDATPFEPLPISAEAWPTADLPPLEPLAPAAFGTNGTNGSRAASEDIAAAPSNGVVHEHEPIEDDDPGARFSFLTAATTSPEAPVEDVASPAEPETVVAAGSEPIAEAAPPDAVAAVPLAPAAQATPPEYPETVDERASALASHTAELFGRFRPGQNIDAELAAFEAGLEHADEVAAASEAPIAEVVEAEAIEAAAQPEPEPIIAAAWPEPDPALVAAAWPDAEAEAIIAAAEPEPIAAVQPEPETAAASEPEPWPIAAAEPEPELVAVEPEPEPIAAAEPEPEPVAAAEPEPEAPSIAASAEPARTDRIEQPTWRIFAPDQVVPSEPLEAPVAPTTPPSTPAVSPQAIGEPQWPAQPAIQDSPSMALLANRTRSSSDALWAASTQEVLAPLPGPAVAAASVQPCSSCGLSLSATARFCRRCGTRQG